MLLKFKPKNHGKPWTVDDMLDMAELYEDGESFDRISRLLKRTESACRSRMSIVIIAARIASASDIGINSDSVLWSLLKEN